MTTTLLELKPSQIKPHKANPRRDVGDVDELAASIAEQGIVEPLVVVPDENGYVVTDDVAVGGFVLIAGHRRLAAAKKAKVKTVPCVIRVDLAQDPKAQIELMLVENLQRTDLSAVEEAEAYQTLLTFPGYTQKRISEKTGRTATTVRARLKMASLPKNALTKIHEGQISLTEASALVDFADDKKAYKRLEDAVGTASFGRVLDKVKGERTVTRKVDRLTKQLTDEGVRIVDPPLWNTPRVIQLYGNEDVEAHRSCGGFAAYLTKPWDASYSTEVKVGYLCDKAELHAGEDDVDADEDARPETPGQRARREQDEQLAAVAADRREYLRAHVVEDASDGLALDLLRQSVHHVIGSGGGTADEVLAAVLGYPGGDKKARGKRIDELDWRQLAIVLDICRFAWEERLLAAANGWPTSASTYDNTKEWRKRLLNVYGYPWSELEQQLVEKAASAGDPITDGDDDVDDEDLAEDD